MTKKGRQSQKIWGIKAALITGSLIASLLGARMVAVNDKWEEQQAQASYQSTIEAQPMKVKPVSRSKSS